MEEKASSLGCTGLCYVVVEAVVEENLLGWPLQAVCLSRGPDSSQHLGLSRQRKVWTRPFSISLLTMDNPGLGRGVYSGVNRLTLNY